MDIIDFGIFWKAEESEIMFQKDNFTKTEAAAILSQIKQAWGINTSLMHFADVSGNILVCTEENGSHYIFIDNFALVGLPKDKAGDKIRTANDMDIANFYKFGIRNWNPGIPLRKRGFS
ncbi:hypothetical protein KKD19_01425 [Patescibacteria group bacterium]|nr:hypothetical protein [Patescibacteria group bacterium]MBU4511893.1 hypothetical protein [Patescibacteria group bacterium]MCG2692860.1 hypothetical protein [Candidatus Parcubacteria bacterium]